MARIKWRGGEIKGHLDIFVSDNEDEDDGKIRKWQEVLIHGDPEGLRTFAKLLIKIADLNQEQETETELPVGAREHYHLRPNWELGKSSVETIVGRLDAKGTGLFYDRYLAKDDKKDAIKALQKYIDEQH
jgi:hypothetical protein